MGRRRDSRVSGVQATVIDVGRIGAPVIVGALITWTGGYSVMLAVVCDRADVRTDAPEPVDAAIGAVT